MYLDNRLDIESFEDWFVENTWNIHKSGSQAAESLTFAIQESLSEYSSGHLDEKKLRDELRQVLNAETKTIVIADAPITHSEFRLSAQPVLHFAQA